jgi:hypothetical protein
MYYTFRKVVGNLSLIIVVIVSIISHTYAAANGQIDTSRDTCCTHLQKVMVATLTVRQRRKHTVAAMSFNFTAPLHPTAPQYPTFPTLPTPEDGRSDTTFFYPETPVSAGILSAHSNDEFGTLQASHHPPNLMPMIPSGLHGRQTAPSSHPETAAPVGQELTLNAPSTLLTASEKSTPLQSKQPSKNAAAKLRKAARSSFELDFDRLMQNLKQDISELAEKHNKKETYVESMIFNGGTSYLRESKASAWNAWLHHKYQEVNDGE